MKIGYFIIGVLFFISCEKDDERSYPISYTFQHEDQSDEALYLIESSASFSHIPVNTGSFGQAREEVKADIKELMLTAFDLREIELQDENSLRINFFIDSIEYDTVLSYSTIDGVITIDSLEGSLLTYDKLTDQFIVCGVMTVALPGPNVPDPGSEYYILNVRECTPGYSKDQYINALLTSFIYEPLDTIGIILSRFYFE